MLALFTGWEFGRGGSMGGSEFGLGFFGCELGRGFRRDFYL